jgi:hypothetical protein
MTLQVLTVDLAVNAGNLEMLCLLVGGWVVGQTTCKVNLLCSFSIDTHCDTLWLSLQVHHAGCELSYKGLKMLVHHW